jgi:superfamily II DNA/RNA helicase
VPPPQPADYVHRAGRVGRVGQLGRGTVLSVLCPAEVPELLALGRELHFAPHERASPEPPTLTDELSLDEKVQILSETYYLFGEEGKQ